MTAMSTSYDLKSAARCCMACGLMQGQRQIFRVRGSKSSSCRFSAATPPASSTPKKLEFARILWVVLLEARRIRTSGPPAHRRPWLDDCYRVEHVECRHGDLGASSRLMLYAKGRRSEYEDYSVGRRLAGSRHPVITGIVFRSADNQLMPRTCVCW